MALDWHALEKHTLLERFSVKEGTGRHTENIATVQAQYGHNVLSHERGESLFHLLVKQFKSPLVIILVFAFFGTLYLEEFVDAFVIALALVVNISIGLVQEYRAARAFEALLSSQEQHVVVLRDGTKMVVPSKTVVPGDIVCVEAGSVIPADAYILSAKDLEVSEAHLTGESNPLHKNPAVLPADTPVYERENMLFSGSPVLAGSGSAIVVATGMDAQIGSIAASLNQYTAGDTPIEKSIQRLAQFLSILIGVVILLLIIFGVLRDIPLSETILLAIALAVSVVPEGLPAAVTAILAIGMERILKEKGLVRNLLAAETLGSTTVVLTDKTGTLTQAKMGVVDLVTASARGFGKEILDDDQKYLLHGAFQVSDAFISKENGEIHGRPIERAVVAAAFETKVMSDNYDDRESERLDFLKFSSSQRFAAALYGRTKTKQRLYFSGAPEILLKASTQFYQNGKAQKLSPKERKNFEEALTTLAKEGKRLIGVSYQDVSSNTISREVDSATLPEGGTFVGLVAFADPPRADVAQAIKEVQGAGVRVVMVTGDTPETALTIAKQVGIAHEGDIAIIGSALESMSDKELYEALFSVPVFARVLPHQKQRLVRVLQAREEIVAMTGDGVNDAPALQTAQIGVAVGSGTEVAREASDLILLDNSFSIIVSAIREGRRMLDNIKKAVTHLVTTSFHEVFIISFAIIAGLPLPVLPVQILWVNILEEGFLTFGFAFEPKEPGLMKMSPRSQRLKTVLTKEVRSLILIAGTITGIFSIALFLWLLSRGLPIEEIRTIMFVVLSLDALLFALSLKRLRKPLWTANFLENRYLLFALFISTAGLVLTLTFEPLRNLLSLTVPNTFDLMVLVGVAVVNLLTIELTKKIAFRSNATLAS